MATRYRFCPSNGGHAAGRVRQRRLSQRGTPWYPKSRGRIRAAAEGIEKLGFRIQRRAGDAAPERAIAARARMSLGARAPDDGRRARLLIRTVAQDGGPRMGRPGAARGAWRRRTQL